MMGEPEPVQEYHVPLIMYDGAHPRMTHNSWDLTTQQIIPYIDGNSHIGKIAAHADVEVSERINTCSCTHF